MYCVVSFEGGNQGLDFKSAVPMFKLFTFLLIRAIIFLQSHHSSIMNCHPKRLVHSFSTCTYVVAKKQEQKFFIVDWTSVILLFSHFQSVCFRSYYVVFEQQKHYKHSLDPAFHQGPCQQVPLVASYATASGQVMLTITSVATHEGAFVTRAIALTGP